MANRIDVAERDGSTAAAWPPNAKAASDRWYSETRLGGLSRFAAAITVLNIAGHLFLGFEQSWITPFVALAAAYATEFLGETVDAAACKRSPRFRGSLLDCVKFLLSAHITGLAVGMLLYACEQLWAVAFAASLAIASKYIIRVSIPGPGSTPTRRHVLNPSNFAITVTLLAFPLVSIAPPYQFTENTSGIVDWLLPLVVICSGTYLNMKATGRLPMIVAWIAAFVAQALIRAAVNGTPWTAGLVPMTGFAFILFTFYMITDPATSPSRPSRQVVFACAVALAYAVYMQLHIVFGLFYALTTVSAVRGCYFLALEYRISAAVLARLEGVFRSASAQISPQRALAPSALGPSFAEPKRPSALQLERLHPSSTV